MNQPLRLFSLCSLLLSLSGLAACGSSGPGRNDAGDGGTDTTSNDRGGTDTTSNDGGGEDTTSNDGGGADTTSNDGGGADTTSNDGGIDRVSDGGSDATDAAPPAMLTATVVDRRQTLFPLAWPAPANNGLAVSGYQVRYAKVPITVANFDDTTVTTSVPYVGTPAAPGAADGLTIKLYIENAYYFAVTGTDAGGNHVGTFMATATAVAAHFNVSILASPSGTNQQFGAILDGSGDVNGDGLSDVLVAAVNDGHAYLFFGGASFAPTVPAVTFSGTNLSFGGDIRVIGDIDKDGLQDVAISDQTAVRVLIYKGRMNWPLTLSDTQADYIITTDATWAASAFGFSMAPLGDFNGDGVDDFVIGAPAFNVRVGRVAVIYGRSGFSSFGLPDATRSLEIGGDAALDRTQFGLAVVGLGHFYSVTTGTTLIVSGPGLGDATSTSANEGRIYAFHGQGPGAAITATAADNVRVGPGKAARIGQTLANLGPVVNSLAAAGVGNAGDALSVPGAGGSAFVLSGTAASGPLMNLLILYQQGGTGIGQVIFGGGFSGRDVTASLIGDGKADIGLTSQTAGTVDIIDGAKVSALTSPANSRALGDVHVPMPTGWTGTAAGAGNLIRDINGDGVPDFALGDLFGVVPGRVAVFW